MNCNLSFNSNTLLLTFFFLFPSRLGGHRSVDGTRGLPRAKECHEGKKVKRKKTKQEKKEKSKTI
jgi:hypothetical protein